MILSIAGQRYALPCAHIVEVTALVSLRRLESGPAWMAGVFAFRGQLTPVVDLSLLVAGRPSAPLLSTRLAVLRVQAAPSRSALLALVAEQMTEVRRIAHVPAESEYAIPLSGLGPVVMDGGELLQVIDERVLLERLGAGNIMALLPTKAFGSEGDRARTQS